MRTPRRAYPLLLALLLGASGCSGTSGGGAQQPDEAPPAPAPSPATSPPTAAVTAWVYQLQGYADGRLDALARAPQQLAVIDLARDGHDDYFRPEEIAALRGSGKRVLAYFAIGSIEDFRPEHTPLRQHAGDLIVNRWADWPDEHFVRYWDPRWWQQVVRPRVDQALRAGFDGVYLDTPLAYEELDLDQVAGQTRERLAQAMVDLIARISRHAKAQRPGFLVFPQNSPELRAYPGYVPAIDGIGMEELFFQATDQPCAEDFCAENLAHARALREAGKLVLAVDYATRPANVQAACRRYLSEGFAGYVGVLDLDQVSAPCA